MTVGAREDLFAIQAKDHDRLIGRVLAGNLYLFLTSIWNLIVLHNTGECEMRVQDLEPDRRSHR